MAIPGSVCMTPREVLIHLYADNVQAKQVAIVIDGAGNENNLLVIHGMMANFLAVATPLIHSC